jgi:hypothetical protein
MAIGGVPCPKFRGLPLVLERQAKKQIREDEEEAFRKEVWRLHANLDRATGQYLKKQAIDPEQRGEVAHLKGRRVRPEWKTDPQRAILLSAFHHALSHRVGLTGRKLLEFIGTDSRKPITFIRRDLYGTELWRTTTVPAGLK